MGLDIVEVQMGCEEEFGVELSEEEFQEVRTVGDLHACILKKFRYMGSPGCLSAKVFYRLRRGLMDALGVARDRVRPKTAMADLVPVEDRPANWQALSRAVDLALPRLGRPGWMQWLIYAPMAAALAAWLAACVAAVVFDWWLAFRVALGAMAMCALGPLADRITSRFAVLLPADCETVGSTVKRVVRHNFGAPTRAPDARTEAEVWERLRPVVAEELAVEPDTITPETRFYEDLRID
ncbi:MAG: hypothetical protein PVH68_13965 [Armatimonadota bacterium]|jgi:acyl carrier protein